MSEATVLHEHAVALPVDPAALREHESRAHEITLFAPTVLPDLLLAADYARALWEQHPNVLDESIPQRLAMLRDRQEAVFRASGPVVRVYTTVAALMSEAVDCDRTMVQRDHQVDLVRRHRRSLQFRVMAEGYSPADRFALLESAEYDPVVYVPGAVTELFLTAPSHVVAHLALLESFDRVAWSAHDSRTFLAELTARDVSDVQTQEQAAALAQSFGFTREDCP